MKWNFIIKEMFGVGIRRVKVWKGRVKKNVEVYIVFKNAPYIVSRNFHWQVRSMGSGHFTENHFTDNQFTDSDFAERIISPTINLPTVISPKGLFHRQWVHRKDYFTDKVISPTGSFHWKLLNKWHFIIKVVLQQNDLSLI